jgi:hypothetical protein
MENGEWRMENGEWRMENGEWREHNFFRFAKKHFHSPFSILNSQFPPNTANTSSTRSPGLR